MSAPLSWKVAAASVVGAGHRRGAIPCQDAHEIRVTAQGWLVGAVADGAGSASHSHLGAKAAVAAAVGVIAAESSQDDFVWDADSGRSTLTTATAAALSAVGQRAEEEGLTPRDLACTLILFAAGDWGIAALQIGDGGLVARAPASLYSTGLII